MRETSSERPPYALDSVSNALRLLLLLRERGELRLTDASNALGVARSTAHRLLLTMAHEGFVEQDKQTRAYRAGRALVEVGLAAVGQLDIRRRGRAHMLALAAELDETVHLLVLEGAGVRFVDGAESNQVVRVTSRVGNLLPAHATSGGKALLADLSEEDVRRMLGGQLAKVTRDTVCDMDKLLTDFQEIRKVGYAMNRGESHVAIRAVAVCIRDRTGRAVAALAVAVPAARGSLPRLRSFVEPLRMVVKRIETDL